MKALIRIRDALCIDTRAGAKPPRLSTQEIEIINHFDERLTAIEKRLHKLETGKDAE